MLSEVKIYIVKTNKIMPENVYNLSFGHSIAVGIALDPGSYFPESMGETNIDSLFKIAEDAKKKSGKDKEASEGENICLTEVSPVAVS
jgi:hypothetical protein